MGDFAGAASMYRSFVKYLPKDGPLLHALGAATSVAATATVTGAASCPADLDGDGVVDSSDLGVLLSAWGGCP